VSSLSSALGGVPGFTAWVYSIHYAHLTAVVTLCGSSMCVCVCGIRCEGIGFWPGQQDHTIDLSV